MHDVGCLFESHMQSVWITAEANRTNSMSCIPQETNLALFGQNIYLLKTRVPDSAKQAKLVGKFPFLS